MDGVTQLVRLVLRRDRVWLPIWVLAITAITLVSGRGMAATFGTQRSIDSYAASIEGSAAAIAMTGPPIGLHTLAGVVINKVATVALVGVCLMAIFEVVRHTRTEEEDGRTELLRSAVVGRHAGVAAVLAVTSAASVLTGLGVAIALRASAVPAPAAWVFGGGIAGLGIAFAAITLLLAQLFSHGRTTLGAALGLLGVAYVVRAVGDVQHSWLVWLSPIGWAQATHPLGENRWWPVLVCLAAAGMLTAIGVRLESHRDLGAGLVTDRPGPATASSRLSGPVGLAWRLQRGAIVGWGCGLFLLAAAIGSLSKQMDRMARDNPTLERYLHHTGQGGIVDSFFSTMLLILALLTAMFAVSSA
ncbi:MAG: ABC transporter permease, partial [Nocardioidaceae bacterium]